MEEADESVKERAKDANFDERLSLLGLILDGIGEYFRILCYDEIVLTEYMNILKSIRPKIQAAKKLRLILSAVRQRVISRN